MSAESELRKERNAWKRAVEEKRGNLGSDSGGEVEGNRCERVSFHFSFPLACFHFKNYLLETIAVSLFPPLRCTAAAAKAGRASDGTVPLCVLPSALLRSLTAKTWLHTQPSRSAVPHPGGPLSRTEKYTYETVYLRRREQGKVLIMSSWHMFYITSFSFSMLSSHKKGV